MAGGPHPVRQKGGIIIMSRSNQILDRKPTGALAAPVSPLSQLFGGRFMIEPGCGARSMKVQKNRDVVIAGSHYESVYAVHDGWLFRYKILHNGSRQIVDFILPGQFFGLQACLFKRSLYSVATVTEARLSSVPFGVIDKVFEKDLELSKMLFWSAVSESAILAEHLIDAGRRSAYERVSHLLLELFVRLNRVGAADGMTFYMPLTQELVGDALGLTTVHVNRTFRSLRDDKLIEIDGKSITILDFEALSLLSDFENSYLGEAARAIRSQTGSAKEKRV
jgi:CRP-like cAMP-binding protein